MINPENTVRQINHAIKARTDRDIVVGWSNDIDDIVSYYVCVDGDDTNLFIWEDARAFEILEDTGRSYASIDDAKTYDGVAAKLIKIVSQEGEQA